MTPALAQREIALAGVALLAVVVGVAVAAVVRSDDEPEGAARAPVTEWYRAVAAPYEFPAEAEQTACGHPADASTQGVAHPVLPCGAKLVILFENREVLTQVVDRGAGAPGREFDVTASLAQEIGLNGVRPVHWRFAPSDS